MSVTNEIRRAALNLLARREHSQIELFRKLLKKNFPESEIHPVLEVLIQEGLLNNTRFIENFIHYQRNKGYGPLHIRQELLSRGLSKDFIEDHLKITDNTWLLSVHDVWQKRFKNNMPKDYKTRVKQMRFLLYRGFTQEQIESLMKIDD